MECSNVPGFWADLEGVGVGSHIQIACCELDCEPALPGTISGWAGSAIKFAARIEAFKNPITEEMKGFQAAIRNYINQSL